MCQNGFERLQSQSESDTSARTRTAASPIHPAKSHPRICYIGPQCQRIVNYCPFGLVAFHPLSYRSTFFTAWKILHTFKKPRHILYCCTMIANGLFQAMPAVVIAVLAAVVLQVAGRPSGSSDYTSQDQVENYVRAILPPFPTTFSLSFLFYFSSQKHSLEIVKNTSRCKKNKK